MWDTQTGIGSPNWPWVSGMGFFIPWVEKKPYKIAHGNLASRGLWANC